MKKLFIFFITIITFTACTDLGDELYDRIPEDEYPENETQAALTTGSVYAPMQTFLDWGGWWFCQEIPSDEMTAPTRATDWYDGGKWLELHRHTWNNQTEAVTAMWGEFYEGIGQANKIIEQLGGDEAEGEGAVTVAKMKIMRAYYYYLLIDNYGDVPFVTSFTDAPDNPEATPRKTIWEKIVADMNESIPYLTSSNTKTAVSKGMAFTLLAKLYLNAEVYAGETHWQDAEAAVDSVIESGRYSLQSDPMAPFVTENSTSPENIFTIPYDEDTYTGFNLHMRTLHYQSNKTFGMTAGPWNGFAVTEDHFKTYKEEDLRKEGYFLWGKQYAQDGSPIIIDKENFTDTLYLDPHIPAVEMPSSDYTVKEYQWSGARVKKFEIKDGAKANLSNDFPIFRYADVLLMKAETMIRQGENGDEYINMIRERAGLDPISNATLDDVLAERGRELFWEAHRRQDLIRFGEFTKSWWEKDQSDKERRTFPIPQWVLDSNPNLQ